jgi:hypothetical protein
MSKEIDQDTACSRAEHIFCSNCGQKLREEGSFCTECGYVIGYDEQPVVVPTQHYPTQQYPTQQYPTQQYPVRKKYGKRVAGAILLSLGSTLVFMAFYLYFLSWGLLVAATIIMGVIGGICVIFGIVLVFSPLKEVSRYY